MKVFLMIYALFATCDFSASHGFPEPPNLGIHPKVDQESLRNRATVIPQRPGSELVRSEDRVDSIPGKIEPSNSANKEQEKQVKREKRQAEEANLSGRSPAELNKGNNKIHETRKYSVKSKENCGDLQYNSTFNGSRIIALLKSRNKLDVTCSNIGINIVLPNAFEDEKYQICVNLDLSKNKISSLPGRVFSVLKVSIKVLDLSFNLLEVVSGDWLYDLRVLEKLVMSNNSLMSLTASFGKLTRLHHLDLSNNPFRNLNSTALAKYVTSSAIEVSPDDSRLIRRTLLLRGVQLNCKCRLLAWLPDEASEMISMKKGDHNHQTSHAKVESPGRCLAGEFTGVSLHCVFNSAIGLITLRGMGRMRRRVWQAGPRRLSNNGRNQWNRKRRWIQNKGVQGVDCYKYKIFLKPYIRDYCEGEKYEYLSNNNGVTQNSTSGENHILQGHGHYKAEFTMFAVVNVLILLHFSVFVYRRLSFYRKSHGSHTAPAAAANSSKKHSVHASLDLVESPATSTCKDKRQSSTKNSLTAVPIGVENNNSARIRVIEGAAKLRRGSVNPVRQNSSTVGLGTSFLWTMFNMDRPVSSGQTDKGANDSKVDNISVVF